MASKISIVSAAANRLGKASVNDLSVNPMYTAMGHMYDVLLGNIISSMDWRFATKIFSLNLINDSPPIEEYEYQFQLPPDLKALWRLYPATVNYNIYERIIYANNSELKAEYSFIPDPQYFPDHFELLLIYAVASDAAMLVTQEVQIAAYWEKKYVVQDAISKSIDARQRPNIPQQFDALYIAHSVGTEFIV